MNEGKEMADPIRPNEEADDELMAEYDLKSLRVRKLGPARTHLGETTIETRDDRGYSSVNSSEDALDESDLC
jgi:hypothetical protein